MNAIVIESPIGAVVHYGDWSRITRANRPFRDTGDIESGDADIVPRIVPSVSSAVGVNLCSIKGVGNEGDGCACRTAA